MGIFNGLAQAVGAIYPRWGGSGWFGASTYFLAPGARYDYEREAGDLWSNSVAAIAIKWLGDRFPRPKVNISKILADGTYKPIANHPAVKLWNRPNPYYTRRAMEKAVGLSLVCDGNAYIQKVRNGGGQVAELWWLPHYTIAPMWKGDDFITGYRAWTEGTMDRILPREDVIHIRDGIDPRNVRLGFSATKAQIREICTINEESGYTASIMRNAGVVGLVLSPRDGEFARMVRKEDADAIREKVRDLTSNDQRGSAMVLQGPYEVKSAGYSPEQLRLKDLPQPAISRIAASIGVAAMSLGLPDPGKTYSNLGEANRTSWGSIKSIQELIGESLRYELLPEFALDPDTYCIEYDYAEIDELQESEDAVYQRVINAWFRGVLTQNETRDILGFDADPDGDRFYPGTGSPTEVPGPGLEAPGKVVPPGSSPPGLKPVGDQAISPIGPAATAGSNGTTKHWY